MEKLNVKRLIILCLPIVFALSLAITLAACMAQAGRKIDDSAINGEDADTTVKDGTVATSKPSNLYSDGLVYEKRADGGCAVVGIGSCTDRSIRIPERAPDGLRVTAIGDSAFLGCNTLESVTLPTGIREIGAYAFYGSSLKSIALTAGIVKIGECCFANCKNLVSVTVDSANEKYCSIDGVLFSNDKTQLICYPSGKTDSEYTVRLGVETISSAAFYGCTYLKSVKFNGNAEEWSRVRIGANNDSLLSLQITFKKDDIK